MKNYLLYLKAFVFPVILCIILVTGCSKTNSSTGLPAINSLNDRNVGASARELLSASTYSSLDIEIQYMPGFQPDAAALNNLTSFLNSLLNKPGGINIHQSQVAASGRSSLSLSDISLTEKNNRSTFTNGSSISVYILITDGSYSDPSVFGVAYRNTSICLFGQTIQSNSGSIGQVNRTKLVTTVLEHELGHLMGLVDIGSPMVTNHKDQAHGNHCNNQNCLMYYSAETTDLLGFLLVGNIPTLDANCITDLRANGGR